MVHRPGSGRTAHASVAGPASYDHTSRPTLAFPDIKYIRNISDVKITAGGYNVDTISISGNIATFRVGAPTAAHTHVFAGSALATHKHNLTPDASTAGAITSVLGQNGSTLEVSKVAPAAMTSCIQSITAGTPSGVNVNNTAEAGDEIPDSTNLSGVTFYGQAYGYTANNNLIL